MASETSSEVNLGADSVNELLRKAAKLYTEAYTAQREAMETLLPLMIDLLKEFDEEEKKLKSTQSSLSSSFASISFRSKTLRSGAATDARGRSKGKMKDSLHSQKSKSDQLLIIRDQNVEEGSKSLRQRPSAPEEDMVLRGNRSFVEIQSSTFEEPPPPPKLSVKTTSVNKKNPALVKGGSVSYQDSSLSRRTGNLSNRSSRSLSKKQLLSLFSSEKTKFLEALEIVKSKAAPSVRKFLSNGSVCGVFNPDTGDIEWKQNEFGGIFGVWDKKRRRVQWQLKENFAIYGVYNPDTEDVEFQDFYNGGVCGVYNPIQKVVEWRQVRKESIFGVWNPVKECVEWRTCKEGGIIGWFDCTEQRVVWDIEEMSGLCRVTRDYLNGGYKTYCCNFCRQK